MAERRRRTPVLGKKEMRKDKGERMSQSTAEIGGCADELWEWLTIG